MQVENRIDVLCSLAVFLSISPNPDVKKVKYIANLIREKREEENEANENNFRNLTQYFVFSAHLIEEYNDYSNYGNVILQKSSEKVDTYLFCGVSFYISAYNFFCGKKPIVWRQIYAGIREYFNTKLNSRENNLSFIKSAENLLRSFQLFVFGYEADVKENIDILAEDSEILQNRTKRNNWFEEAETLHNLTERYIYAQCKIISVLYYILIEDYNKAEENLLVYDEVPLLACTPGFYFVHICRILLYVQKSKNKDLDFKGKINELVETLKVCCSENVETIWVYYWAQAEESRILLKSEETVSYYEKTISSLSTRENQMFEAYLTTHIARYLLNQGLESHSKPFLYSAYNQWVSWGSEVIPKYLLTHYKFLLPYEISKGQSSINSHNKTQDFSKGTSQNNTVNFDFDFKTILNVAQSLSEEVNLDELLTKIMRYVMVSAGAKKGVLILQEEGKLKIHVCGKMIENKEVIDIIDGILVEQGTGKIAIPLSVIYYTYRSRQPVLISNPKENESFMNDPYIKENNPKSILCCPIIYQNTVSGVIYLENDLHGAAFTTKRIDLVKSLMSSASISIENARLTKTNNELTSALRETVVPKYNVDAPIKKMIDILKNLQARMSVNDPVAKQLDYVMKTLTSNDFFASNIDQLNDDQGHGVDSDTLDWIQNSLLQSRLRAKPNVVTEEMFFNLDEDTGHELSSTEALAESGYFLLKGQQIGNTPLNLIDITRHLEQATTMDFDIFDLYESTNGIPLQFLSMHFLNKYGLIQYFNLDETLVRTYFQRIEGSYRQLPYHNSIHAADVLQTLFLLVLGDQKMASCFTKLEIFAACVASAVHDVDHPGLNNNFLIQTQNPLAIFYNDISVLEYHHAAKAFQIAKDEESNIFKGMSSDQVKEVRKYIINMVIATDMAQHFTYINKLKGKIAASSLKLEDPADRALVLEMAIKCADLNNPTKPLEQCKKWAFRGDREIKLNIPVSKFMDRNDTCIPNQVGFIDILVTPLFDTWSQCIRTDFTKQCTTNIESNRSYWESIMNDPSAMPAFHPPTKEELEAEDAMDEFYESFNKATRNSITSTGKSNPRTPKRRISLELQLNESSQSRTPPEARPTFRLGQVTEENGSQQLNINNQEVSGMNKSGNWSFGTDGSGSTIKRRSSNSNLTPASSVIPRDSSQKEKTTISNISVSLEKVHPRLSLTK
ncbi:High affinity cAMP-specific and IBMX-insensitive 3',5'-cyclic phosphodiesterase 8A [Nowakowskiella sp. JEL0078]|nr:High affinity cAMP-specific and IBMX-insensitive 3',5'-cyclic phosphodiesterase 8A [Nowakowskiella sp. JEL0078]